MKTYTITSTDSGVADDITLTDGASGSTLTISDDSSWDGLAAADDNGDIGAVVVGTTAGGDITLNIAANEDALTHAATTFSSTEITKSANVTINSTNSDSNQVNNSLTSLKVDNAETQTISLVGNANAGLVVGT